MVDHLAVDHQFSSTVIPGQGLLLPLFTAVIACSCSSSTLVHQWGFSLSRSQTATLLRFHEWSFPALSRRHNLLADFLVFWFLHSSHSPLCLRYRNCVVDVSGRTWNPTVLCILPSWGALSWSLLSRRSFSDEGRELYLPVSVRMSLDCS